MRDVESGEKSGGNGGLSGPPEPRGVGLQIARAESPSEKGLVVSLTIIEESLTAQTYGLGFQSDCADGKIVQCGITNLALADLVDFHHIKGAAAGALRVLLPEIERLANAKYEAGRLEEDGGLLI